MRPARIDPHTLHACALRRGPHDSDRAGLALAVEIDIPQPAVEQVGRIQIPTIGGAHDIGRFGPRRIGIAGGFVEPQQQHRPRFRSVAEFRRGRGGRHEPHQRTRCGGTVFSRDLKGGNFERIRFKRNAVRFQQMPLRTLQRIRNHISSQRQEAHQIGCIRIVDCLLEAGRGVARAVVAHPRVVRHNQIAQREARVVPGCRRYRCAQRGGRRQHYREQPPSSDAAPRARRIATAPAVSARVHGVFASVGRPGGDSLADASSITSTQSESSGRAKVRVPTVGYSPAGLTVPRRGSYHHAVA